MSIEEQRYLTYSRAARYLGYSENSLRIMVYRKQIPFIRKGSMKRCRIFFDVHDLDEWMLKDRIASEEEHNAKR